MIKEKHRFKQFLSVAIILALCFFLTACQGLADGEDMVDSAPTVANCWVCSIYGSVFQLANDFISNCFGNMFPFARAILFIGLAFTLLYRVGSMLFFAPLNSMVKTMKDTGFLIFKVIIISALLADETAFLNLIRDAIVYPIGQFILMIANAVLDTVPETGKYFGGLRGVTPDTTGLIKDGKLAAFSVNTSVFGDLGIQVQYIVSRIFAALNSGFVLVRHLFVIGGVFSWIIAIVIAWQLFNLIILFPLAFGEAFIWLAFYIVLMPIALALWAFPKTSDYLKKLFPEKFLSPFLNVLFGSIIAILMISLLQLYTDLALNGILRTTTQETNAWVSESAAGGRPSVFILALLCIIMRKIAMDVGDFTAKFGGEKEDSSFFKLVNQGFEKLKAATVTLAKIAIAAAITGGASAVGDAAKAVGKEAVKAAAQAAADGAKKAATGGSGGSSGESKEETA